MADSVTYGQLKRFLKRYGFTPQGKKNVIYKGIIDGELKVITVHFHKDRDIIRIGTLKSMAAQLGVTKKEFVDLVKRRS